MDETKIWRAAWIGQPDEALRAFLANAERPGANLFPPYGYDQRTENDDPAFGRYQLLDSSLAGLKLKALRGPDGWAGTEFAAAHAIASDADFLGNEEAQEAAMTAYLADLDAQAERLYARFGGRRYVGILGQSIAITRYGLIAALHREGIVQVERYFGTFKGGDTQGREAEMNPQFKAIETRLRGAQSIQDAPAAP